MSGSHKSNRINPGEVGVVAFACPIRATRSQAAKLSRSINATSHPAEDGAGRLKAGLEVYRVQGDIA
jgi:hypothetical protein